MITWPESSFKWQGARNVTSGGLFATAAISESSLSRKLPAESGHSAWEHFRRDKRLQRLHNVAADEMEMLGCVARMGQIESSRTFVYILNAVRYALGR